MALPDWYLPIINESLHELVYDLFPEGIREKVKGWWTARMNGFSTEIVPHDQWVADVELYLFINEEMENREDIEAAVSAIVEDMCTALRNDLIRERWLAKEVAERFSKALAFLLHSAKGTPLKNALNMAA